MTTVAKIIYVSRQTTPGSSPGVQQLLLYDSNGDLIWIGTRATTSSMHSAINPSEWEVGSWTAVFDKGGFGTETYGDTPSDTTTASVSATVTKYTGTASGNIVFEYDGKRYISYLTNYQHGTNIMAGVSTGLTYYTYTPYAADSPTPPSYSEANARAVIVISNWTYNAPTVYAETVSPGTSIDVIWTAPSPTYAGSGSASVTAATVALYVSTNPNMTGATSYELSGTSGTKNLTGLTKDRTYYFQVATSYTTSDGETPSGASNVAQADTIKPLDPPTVNGVAALDGAGSATWTAVENAAGYEYGVTDDAETPPVSGTSISGTTWTFDDETLKGKFLFVRSIAESNQFVYENSGWPLRGVEIPATESGGDSEAEPTTAFLNRRIYKAIPYIDVPVEQIGLGGNVKDAITVEYADNRYLRSDGEGGAIIPTASLPWAVYGTTSSASTDTVINPAYLESRIGALDLAYTITEIATSSAQDAPNFGGVTTDISSYSSNSEDYYIPTTKAVKTFVTTPANLPFANGTTSDGAGIIYISGAANEGGHGLSATNGLLEVNFATFSTWNTTSPYTVVNPSYVKSVVLELGVQNSATSYSSGTDQTSGNNIQSGYFVKLSSDGKISSTLLPEISLTKTIVDTTARSYGTGPSYTYSDRAQAISNLLNTYSGSLQEGDFIIVSPTGLTDENREHILQGTFVVTNNSGTPGLVEVNTPEWAVTSVNGQTGVVTQAELGLVTSIRPSTTATDTNFPSEKAVRTELNTLNTNKLNTSDFATTLGGYYSETTTVAGLTNDDGIITGHILGDVLGDFETSLSLGTAASADVSSGIADGDTGLVTGDQVYDYAATKSHTHPISQIEYTVSGDDFTGAIASEITTLTTSDHDYIPTAKAVYDYQPLITRIKADSSHNFSATTTDLSTVIPSENYSIPTAYAVQQYVDNHAFDPSQIPAATWTAGTSDWSDTGTGFVNLNYLAAALTDYDTDLTVASSKVQGIQTVSDPSASSTFGNVVKTEADWGQISASLIPIDDNSITLVSDTALQVSTSWLYNMLDGRYLESGDAQTGYIKMLNTNASAWTSGTAYEVGDLVYASDGQLWRCITDNTASGTNQPGTLDTGNNYLYWVPAKLAVERRYDTTLYGDGATTEFTVAHKLGTRFVQVTMADSAGNEVYPALKFLSTSQVQIGFGNPPASGTTYSVVVRA